MDDNLLRLSLKKFVTRGFFEEKLEFPQIVKNAKLLYRDLISGSHIVYMAELYKQYSDQNYISRCLYSASLKAFDPSSDGEPPLYLKELVPLFDDFAKGHFCSSINSSVPEGGGSGEDFPEGEQLSF